MEILNLIFMIQFSCNLELFLIVSDLQATKIRINTMIICPWSSFCKVQGKDLISVLTIGGVPNSLHIHKTVSCQHKMYAEGFYCLLLNDDEILIFQGRVHCSK